MMNCSGFKKWIPLLCWSLMSSAALANERALWVWGMSSDIVLEKQHADRPDFYSFLAAPHGNPQARLTTLFMSIHPAIIREQPDRVQAFLQDAHSRGFKVEYLTGDPTWALTDIDPATGEAYGAQADREIDLILAYNAAAGDASRRFDGLQFDVEPYIMKRDKDYPYTWDDAEDRAIIWPQYLSSLTRWQAAVTAYRAASGDPLRLGVAIPRHWKATQPEQYPADHKQVQALVDYVAIMDYDVRGTEPVDGMRSILDFAEDPNGDGQTDDAKLNSVYAGLETIDITWKEKSAESFFDYLYPHSSSYFSLGNQALETAVSQLQDEFEIANDYRSYIGTAHHYYEDLRNGETSYRALDLQPHNHAPYVCVQFPAGGQVMGSALDIRYQALDPDQDALTMSIYLSTDAGQTWTLLPAQDKDNHPMATPDGLYRLDLSARSPGAYRIKVVATETQAGGLSGQDVSDTPFEYVSELLDQQAPTLPAGSIQCNATHPARDFEIAWPAFTDEGPVTTRGILGYYYSLTEPNQAEQVYFTTARSGFLHAHADTSVQLKVWALDRSGNSSLPITANLSIHPDSDQDGVADVEDADQDGDGIRNEQELLDHTDPHNSQSYTVQAIEALWEFDGHSLANALDPSENMAITAGASAYETTQRLHGGDDALRVLPGTRLQADDSIAAGEIQALTVEMWIKPENKDALPYIPLFYKGDIDYGMSLILKNDADYATLRFYWSGHGHEGQFVGLNVNNDLLFDGQWHHVAGVYNGPDHSLKFYIDGVLAAQTMNRRIPSSFQQSEPLRICDGRGSWDSDNTPPAWPDVFVDYENSAQFENNLHWDWIDYPPQYEGLLDDIRVTRAAVPPEHLGFNNRAIPYSNLDTDGDGWSDFHETLVSKTNPNLADSDQDGWTDGKDPEPLSSSKGDLDGDGLDDAQLAFVLANPQADYDGDGLADAREYRYGLNFARRDQNQNGVPDGQDDFDADGASNQAELLAGSDPWRTPQQEAQEQAARKVVAGGSDHSVAVKSDGSVWCWGSYQFGQLGNTWLGNANAVWPDTRTSSWPLPVEANFASDIMMVEVDSDHLHTLALDEQGNVYQWGSNLYGDLGLENLMGSSLAAPVKVKGLPPMRTISAGYYHNLGLSMDGVVWAWGSGWQGQLGIGFTGAGHKPVALGLRNIVAIAAGCRHSVALDNEGQVWCWGDNRTGAVGNGTLNNAPVPVKVLSGAKAIAAGTFFSLALKTDGAVYAWGQNDLGQLGDGTTQNRLQPTRSGTINNAVQIAAAYATAWALTGNNQLYGWGDGRNGQLGGGLCLTSTLAIEIAGVTLQQGEAICLNPADWHVLLARGDGSVYTWGVNHLSQLGYLSPLGQTHRQPPRPVASDAGVFFNRFD